MKYYIIINIFLINFLYGYENCKKQYIKGYPDNRTGIIIKDLCYETHRVGFSEKYKMPMWVEYHLEKSILDRMKKISRPKYKFDPKIPEHFQLLEEYENLDFIDKGHLAPYAAIGLIRAEKKIINYMSNLTPQNSGLNSGCWAYHEKRLRALVKSPDIGNMLVTAGVLFKDINPTIQRGVLIPSHYYMSILYLSSNKIKIILFPNKERDKDTCEDKSYYLSEEEFEDFSNIYFYPKR